MLLPPSVFCLSVRLFVCLLDHPKSYEHILIEFFGGVERRPKNSQSDSGGDPYEDPDTGIF